MFYFLPTLMYRYFFFFQGDEEILLRAVNLVHRNQEYISVLFYASWCPFSKICKPNFRKLSTVFPSIRHFAFEESVIRPRFAFYYVICCFMSLSSLITLLSSFIEFIVLVYAVAYWRGMVYMVFPLSSY
jgi:hypothetical protein